MQGLDAWFLFALSESAELPLIHYRPLVHFFLVEVESGLGYGVKCHVCTHFRKGGQHQ